MRAHRRIEKICDNCGEPFQARLTDHQRGLAKTCSRRCRSMAAARNKKKGRNPTKSAGSAPLAPTSG